MSGRPYWGPISVGAVFRDVLSVGGETDGYQVVSSTDLRVVEVLLFGWTGPTAFESHGVLLTVDGPGVVVDTSVLETGTSSAQPGDSRLSANTKW